MKCAAARIAAVAAVFAAVMTVGACRASSHDDAGSRPETSATVGSAHSTEDVRFLQDMVGHHGQAVELAALVPDHSSDPRSVVLNLLHCVAGALAGGGDEADAKLAEASAAIARLIRS